MPPVVTNISHHIGAGDVPVLGGVPTEELIKITGLGFAPDVRVHAGEISMFPILTKHGASTGTEIQVFLPTMRAMQTSTCYKRNSLVTNLTLTVENPSEPGPTNVSAPWVIPIILGPPQVNAPAVLSDKQVSFGTTPDENAPPEAVDDLGSPGGPGVDDGLGQIWFYQTAPALPTIAPATMLPGGCNSITLPSALASSLATIRKSGTRLTVASGDWHDDSLKAQLPPKASSGSIIVWRDDIPSKPVPISQLLPPGVTCDQVQGVLAQMFKLNPDPAVPLNLNPGQVLHLGVTPLPTGGLNPVIVNLLGTLTIKFAFKVTGLAANKMHASGSNVGASPVPSGSMSGTLLALPDLFPQERNAPAPSAFTVQLVVSVTLPDCGTIQAAGNLLHCQQLPLGIPTIAVFFEDSNFDGSPMIVLPKETKLPPPLGPGLEIDDNNSGPLLNARNTIGNTLSLLATTLGALSFFAGVASIPGADEISLLSQLASKVNAAGHLVINSVGKMDDLEDAVVESHWYGDDDFDDEASSMIMVGSAGFGNLKGFKIKGFDEENQDTLKVTWSLPSGRIIAAVPDFENMNTPHKVNATTIALPYGGGTSPTGDFDDDMESLQVVSN